LFCSAVGDPGTGKSHLIRWLYSRLQLGKDIFDKFKFVLIPRNCANLTTVLECILSDYDTPEVRKIKDGIKWTHNITQIGACRKVIAELAFILDRTNISISKLKFPEDIEHQIILELLPAFLNDDSINQYLTSRENGIVSRLADHLTGTREKRPDDEESLVWKEKDLSFGADVIKKAGEKASELASAIFDDDNLKKVCVSVLNQANSAALPNLIGLKQGNLAHAFLEIRRILKSNGKNLILLIEDLSITQGVDAELVEALLVAPSDGGNDLCELRSIVGLTKDDFSRLQENLKGRIDIAISFDLKLSPVGKEKPNTVTTKDINDFATRYLNTTRYKLDELDSWIKQNSKGRELPSYCKIKICPYIEKCHSIFGEVEGRGLYPLSTIAIERLYRSQIDSQSPFNPRKLVRGVLSEFLTYAEETIKNNSFPSEKCLSWFNLTQVNAQTKAQLSSALGETDGKRFVIALEIYSKNQFSGKLDQEIAKVFKLPIIKEYKEKDKTKGQVNVKEQKPQKQDVVQLDDFDNWVNKGIVSDQNVNRWRQIIYAAILGWYDWGSDPIGHLFFKCFQAKNIRIAGQRTRVQTDIVLDIKNKPEIGLALRGLKNEFRIENKKRTREELLYASEYIQLWVLEILRKLRKLNRTPGTPKPNRIALQALILGAYLHPDAPLSKSPKNSLRIALSPWYKSDVIMENSSFALKSLHQTFNKLAEKVRENLYSRIVCRKGKSEKVSFIDCSKIYDDLAAINKFTKPSTLPNQAADWQKSLYKNEVEINEKINQHFEQALINEKIQCKEWLSKILNYLGNQNVDIVCDTLLEAYNLGNDLDLFDMDTIDLQEKIQQINEKDLKKEIKLLKKASGDASAKKNLHAISTIDRKAVADILIIFDEAKKHLKKALSTIELIFDEESVENPNKMHDHIEHQIDDIIDSLEKLKGDEKDV